MSNNITNEQVEMGVAIVREMYHFFLIESMNDEDIDVNKWYFEYDIDEDNNFCIPEIRGIDVDADSQVPSFINDDDMMFDFVKCLIEIAIECRDENED